MRKNYDGPWEAWGLLFIVIVVAALPVITGYLAFKVYRSFKPLESDHSDELLNVSAGPEDSFFKKYLVGWVISAPILYFLYITLL